VLDAKRTLARRTRDDEPTEGNTEKNADKAEGN
jgi:hypothetical protein